MRRLISNHKLSANQYCTFTKKFKSTIPYYRNK